ncbi:MAG: isopenicillin N synthase family oxygenase [Burkholderiales bacterium]|nr:isopenicillin N synthase family oxygenase [Burkholderiales bacterium]
MNVLSVNFEAADAPERFATSLRETGFAVLRNHPLSQSLIDAIYRDWTDFFASDDKRAYLFDRQRQDGWFPADISETAVGQTQRDIKEFFHVYTWGRIPPALRDDALCYHAEATALASRLLQWVEAALPLDLQTGLSEPLSNMIRDSDRSLLRVLHYPPLCGKEPPGALRAAAHEDINLLTILPAASAPGLQVRDRQGQWHDVPVDPGAIVVNVGDMLQEATGGWLPSTSHRVCNPADAGCNTSRLSLPLFLHPRGDVVLSARYTAGSYLDERLASLGVRS